MSTSSKHHIKYMHRLQIKTCTLENNETREGNPLMKRADRKYCLGVESTADDFGVGISTFEGDIVANASNGYIPEEGGIHPREAARHHAELADKVLQEALTKAGIKPRDLSIIAFSQG